jgi:HAD domain in Swiss Army Knife RNA repair proteins
MPLDRPLLLVDIDGVLSLFGFDPAVAPAGRFITVDGIIHLLSIEAGERLQELATDFELVWCSGWEEKADEHLPFALGLPAGLPHLSFDTQAGDGARHWKLAAIDRFAGPERPLAWIDDAHDDTCRAWAAARPAPTLLVGTEPATGLTPDHAARLRAWAMGLPSAS